MSVVHLLRPSIVAGALFLLLAGCFTWPGSSGLGDDDAVFDDDDAFGDDDSAVGDDDTGGPGDDDTGGPGDDDSAVGDDDTGGPGDDDTGGPGDDDTGGPGDDDTGDDDTGGPGDDDDSALVVGAMSLIAFDSDGNGSPDTTFPPLVAGQSHTLPFRVYNGSEGFVPWSLQLDVNPTNGTSANPVFLITGGTVTGSLSPLTFLDPERGLVFNPSVSNSYVVELRLFHEGINVDGSQGSLNQNPAIVTFTADAQTSSESDCTDSVDNDGDGDIDCADSDCDAICPCGECCDDTIDNDGDGDIDCADSDCSFDPACLDFCCSAGGDENTYTLCLDPTCRDAACAALGDCCSGNSATGGWFGDCVTAYVGCGASCPSP